MSQELHIEWLYYHHNKQLLMYELSFYWSLTECHPLAGHAGLSWNTVIVTICNCKSPDNGLSLVVAVAVAVVPVVITRPPTTRNNNTGLTFLACSYRSSSSISLQLHCTLRRPSATGRCITAESGKEERNFLPGRKVEPVAYQWITLVASAPAAQCVMESC